MTGTVRFDIRKLQDDLAEKGWLPTDLAKRAGVSDMTVSRFLKGEFQTNRTAAKLAKALGRTTRRYLIRSGSEAAA